MGTEIRSRASVLIVDDEEPQCRLLSFLLRRDYDVSTALDGAGALALARQRRFDVAVVDYRMPGMTGTEVLRKMKELQPSCLRILMTAHALPSILEEATTVAGIYRFLSKPVDAEVLRIDLQRALEHQRESGRGVQAAEPPRLGDLAHCVARELDAIGEDLVRARSDALSERLPKKDAGEALAGAALKIGRIVKTLRALPVRPAASTPQWVADAVRAANRTWDERRVRALDPTLSPQVEEGLPPLPLPSGALEHVILALAQAVGHEACTPTAIMIRARRVETDLVALEAWREGARPAPPPPSSRLGTLRVFDAELALDFNIARWIIEGAGGQVSQIAHDGKTQAITVVIPSQRAETSATE